jgi:hypothetical protein
MLFPTSSHINYSAILRANKLARSVDGGDENDGSGGGVDDNVAEGKESDALSYSVQRKWALDCRNRKGRGTWVEISCLVVKVSRLVANITCIVVKILHLVVNISCLAVKI